MTNVATRFILAKISPLKYLVTITSLWVGITIPVFVFDEMEYRLSGIILALASIAVLWSFKRISIKWIKFTTMFAFLVWLFISVFAVADGYWEAALWLTFPNVAYFAYMYLFASVKLEYLI